MRAHAGSISLFVGLISMGVLDLVRGGHVVLHIAIGVGIQAVTFYGIRWVSSPRTKESRWRMFLAISHPSKNG